MQNLLRAARHLGLCLVLQVGQRTMARDQVYQHLLQQKGQLPKAQDQLLKFGFWRVDVSRVWYRGYRVFRRSYGLCQVAGHIRE
jgi:hypothetical protein